MNLRGEKRTEFPQSVRKKAFARCCQKCSVEGVENIPGVPQCEGCGNVLKPGRFIYEHVQADGLGGEPTDENCKVHCDLCKKTKDKADNAVMRKADAVLKKHFGLGPTKSGPKIAGRGFASARPQKRASSPVNKWRGF